MPKIVIAGGAWFLGRVLVRHFAGLGWEVAVLSRELQYVENAHTTVWDGSTPGPWTQELESAEVVVNLAGRSVNCRYNERNKAAIYSSRLNSTRVIGEAISKSPNVKVWLNSSAATIYRHAEDQPMDEDGGEIGSGFSVDVAQKWESELERANVAGVRKVAMRTAIVFGSERGGALDPLERLVKWGFGGTQGPGSQFVSWVHEDDYARAVEWLIAHDDLEGPVNISSPNPLPNRDFMAEMRAAYNAPAALPTPKWLLEFGARLIATETELILKSRRVVPKRLLESGFEFAYPTWPEAIRDLAKKRR